MNVFAGITKEKTINKVIEVDVNKIEPNPHQPRRYFDLFELEQLSASIVSDGILQPLTVRKKGDEYELISGERRLRAAKMANLDVVPCIVVEMTERNSALMALVENIQRCDLSFFEEATAIAELLDFYGMTQEDASSRLGMAQSTIANKLRLLKLSTNEKELITKNGLTERHARALLRLKSAEQRLEAIDKIIKYELNVEKTEDLINRILKSEQEMEKFQKRSILLRDVRLFVNTINKAVETMKMAGVQANSVKTQKDDTIEFVITIPVINK